MIRTLPRKDSRSITAEVQNDIQIKENSHLFNHVDKLAADHDVHVSNTMIKVTYKKALKDQNASDIPVESVSDIFIGKTMNHSEANRRKSKLEPGDLCASDISFIAKSPKVHTVGSKPFVHHSTPKPRILATDKKKKYVNGLGLSPKPNEVNEKSSSAKIQKGFLSQEESATSQKKSKGIQVKGNAKPEVSKRFLTGNGSVVKSKNTISQKRNADTKKLTLTKNTVKKIKKLENGVKKKEAVKKGLKRKASNSELNVSAKKMKISENKTDDGGKLEDNSGLGSGKKQIMLVDPDLPAGWSRYIRTKNKGSANEQYVVYVVNPQGKKFRFKWKLRQYLEKTNSSLDVDRFFFGLYQRPKSTNTSAADRDETSTSRGKSPENQISSMSGSKQDEGLHNESSKCSDGKELLLHDPDLPFGWKRVIHSDNSSGKKQVHIISPDGKIFRRRYRLNEYLVKHQYTHNLDRFYFGLYPKKEGESTDRESEYRTTNSIKSNNSTSNTVPEGSDRGKEMSRKISKNGRLNGKTNSQDHSKGDDSAIVNSESDSDDDLRDNPHYEGSDLPMYEDPNLPDGWKRLVKIQSCGESSGQMKVIIISPDGRRHRSKKHLERYLSEKGLQYKVEDFDFQVFGKSESKKSAESAPEPSMDSNHITSFSSRKKFTNRPVPDLDIDSLKEIKISPEGHMINAVNGLLISCGLSSARTVRRQRLPRKVQEKQLKTYLSSEGDVSCDGCEIPTFWIQRLVNCRADFRTLEPEAVSTVGEAAKEFIKKISSVAFSASKEPDRGLRYEDVAELVHKTESLSPLQSLIPQKITYKEYIKLNRPKQFLSFT